MTIRGEGKRCEAKGREGSTGEKRGGDVESSRGRQFRRCRAKGRMSEIKGRHNVEKGGLAYSERRRSGAFHGSRANHGTIDCRQDDNGGGQGSRWQDQLRGVYQDGGEHGYLHVHDPGQFCTSPPFFLSLLRMEDSRVLTEM